MGNQRHAEHQIVQEAKARVNHALTCFKRILADGGWETMVLDDHEDNSEEEDEFEEEEDEENIEFKI